MNAGFNNGGIQPFNNGVGFNSGGIQTQRVAGGFASLDPLTIKANGKKIIQVNTVCIDYGLKIPNPRVPYTIVRVSDVSSDNRLPSLMKLLASSRISADSAQILAWHINSGIDLNTLVANGEISISQKAAAEPYISQL
jgi:hypothetical protein